MASEAAPIRWLHLSDFHVGKDNYATLKMFDYIRAHVSKRKSEGFTPDFLFITGDLANKGLASEYDTFWLEFVSPLQDEIGNNISQRTFVVPGNHDVDRTKHPAFSQNEIAKPESHYLDPNDEGNRLRGDMLIPRFRGYLDSDCTLVKGAFAKTEGTYSQCLTIHGQDVGIVGINTAWLSKDEKDERKLTPGKPLLEKALDTIKSTKLRIVLGHHPVDWFVPAQQKSIKSLLGQSHVLYLHGHLHDAWAEPSYGGGQSYLAIQAGAGFQAREGEPWRNGLVWGEADLHVGEVKLQPWRWIQEQQDWTLATDAFHEHHRQGDWWHYPLPSDQPTKVNYATAAPVAQPPKGWSVFKPDDLATYCQSLDEGVALRYFDGAVPDWNTALSTSIPRRRIVGNLADRFQHAATADKSIVTLLLAAACEGKTTALLQTAYAIVEKKNEWRILQRRDESQPLPLDEIIPVLDKNYKWLLLLDEADHAVGELQTLLKSLPHSLHGRVHALLACRDTDWLASGAHNLNWSATADFHMERLNGLELTDAQAIVQCWQAYGDTGLGNLAKVPETERAAILERQAKDEARTQSEAFFGALLSVRCGSDLHNHTRLLLDRLGQRKISSGGTLRDALAYISAMHTKGLEFLSRPVLAQALGCPLEKLHREVLVPLGQEAAATTTSSFIFTRHWRIAETTISVLEKEFGEDIGTRYVELSQAAIDYSKVARIPAPENLKQWRFEISNHFLAQNRTDLAINIAEAVLDREPTNSLTRTHVANLYRKALKPDQAIRVFGEITTLIEGNRAFYYEWGVTEGECSNSVENVMLAAYSLADQCSKRLIDNDQAQKSLTGLGVPFGALYDAYHEPVFRDARMAVVVLGQTLHLNATSQSYFDKHARETTAQGARKPELKQAVSILQAGIVAAERIGLDVRIGELLPKAEEMAFDGLRTLTLNFVKSQKK
jgi:predicted MPP superfamily phosphohydrolase